MQFQNMHIFIVSFAIIFIAPIQAQFWKLNGPSERELFIMETKASMASGICYKQGLADTIDPRLRTQLLSYCCDGYKEKRSAIALKCEPICAEDCSNGLCTAPDVCECYPGYERMGGRCEEA